MTTQHRNYGYVDSSVASGGQTTWQASKISKRGEQRVIDFLEQMLQEGRCYQVRLGTITTPVAMDSVLTDANAEMCYDAGTGLTIIPIQIGVAPREIATALTISVALKGVAAISTAGTAFVPLPLLANGAVASGTARAANNGGVTVTAEVAVATASAVATVRIFEYENNITEAPTTFKGGLDTLTQACASAKLQYIGMGPACIYLQLAAATAFPLTHSHLNVMELLTTSIG